MNIQIRNLTLYRCEPDSLPPIDELHPLLEQRAEQDRLEGIPPSGMANEGWLPVLGKHGSAYCERVNDCLLLRMGQADRILPPSVVNEELERRCDEYRERTGKLPGGRRRRELKEQVMAELMPLAFIRTRSTLAWIDRRRGWLAINTASRATAELVPFRLRVALGSFRVTPPTPMVSPRLELTSWLDGGECPAPWMLGDEAELRDLAEDGAIIRCVRQDLTANEVREHLAVGHHVFRLGLAFSGRVACVLGEDLTLRKIRFLAEKPVELLEIDDTATALLADFTLQAGDLGLLLDDLATRFAIPHDPALRLDDGEAPRCMRASQ